MSWWKKFMEDDGTTPDTSKNAGNVEKKTESIKMPETVAVSTATKVDSASGAIKFPQNEPAPVIGATNCEPHMEAVMTTYEKGFESLNLPGVDFFEFFKSVASAGMDNPQAYTMAFSMLRSMEPSLSKEMLIEKSKHYVTEIEKVHQSYYNNGKVKRTEILDQKSVETATLKSDIELLEQQLETIKNQIEAKKIMLDKMDSKYNPSVEVIDCKMAANDMAKDKILGAITKVINGINNNL